MLRFYESINVNQSFEILYKQFGPMVYRRCKVLLKDEEEATDLMHDVFVELIRRYDLESIEHPSSLLYTIATTRSLNKLRLRKRKPEHSLDETLLSIAHLDDEIVDRIDQGNLIERIFSKEAPSTRLIATLHFVDRMTLDEVAQHVGLSVSGVRKRLRILKERAQGFKEVNL